VETEMKKIFFSVLRAVVREQPFSDEERGLLSKCDLSELIKFAKKYDMAHLIAHGLLNGGLIEDIQIQKQLKRVSFQAVFRYQNLQYEFVKACELLEESQIPYLPLKGCVLRELYPQPWMRTSCDVDVLVKKEHLEEAVSLFTQRLQYTRGEQNGHDVALFSPNGFNIELHYDLIEDGLAKASSSVLASVWNSVMQKADSSYGYEMTDELFYFYHIAHMAKHFENGGCGIRPFLDLWLLDSNPKGDRAKRDALLEEGGLLTFSKSVRHLSQIWFADAVHDAVSQQVEDYILDGGVYGTSENKIAVQQQKKGGKRGYMLSRIFLPYEELKFYYPILQKHRWLTPFMEIRRWFKVLFFGDPKRAVGELQYNGKVEEHKARSTQELLKNIGLQK